MEKHRGSVNTLGLVSSSSAQLCPEKEWQPPLAILGLSPGQAEGRDEWEPQHQDQVDAWLEHRAQRAAFWTWVSGPASPAKEPLPLGGRGLAWSWHPGLFFTSQLSCCHLGISSGWGHLGAEVRPLSPALPCPELRDGRSAAPGYCLWCLPTASLQPSSTPCLQGLFPNSCSNHTPRFRKEPLLFLPPSLIRGGTEEEG